MADGFHNNTRTDTSANAAGLFDRVPPHDDNAEMATLGGKMCIRDSLSLNRRWHSGNAGGGFRYAMQPQMRNGLIWLHSRNAS